VTSQKIEVMKERMRLLTSPISRFKSGRTGEGADVSPGQGQESSIMRSMSGKSPVRRSRSGKPGNEVEVRKAW
jgi:hypothetical protein